MNERPTLRLTVRSAALPVVHAELQVVHVSPNGIVDFPNRSEFEITHLPGSPDVFSEKREFRVDLAELSRRQGEQVGHLYAVMIHSQPRSLDFLDGMVLETEAPGFESVPIRLNLGDHAALLGVWWQNRAGEWAFEYSGRILDTMNATYQAIFLAGQYAERFADR
ncbi:hypothetical protein DAERI_010261 [Deinococcus aerius]|uniref:Uncharacterized protein n=1 Tax=Deinococcus aerius TaxID=200253 RepID=A0A2I9CRF5_9DEIO|nr:hypothetical protein [Deinococcus aerius]GBF04089.1 hypothetical protein DAERI_010261 [Deinococcus aerius]